MPRPRYDRPRNPSGMEPIVARSALRLRLPLAVFGFIVFSAVTAAAVVWDHPPFDIVVLGAGCAVLAVVALIDIFVVLFRLSQRRSSRSHAGEVRER